MAKSESVGKVVEAIVENRKRFEAFCYSLSDEELMRPVPGSTWVVRDFAAHLGTLDVALQRWFDEAGAGRHVDGGTTATGEPFDVDAFNDAQVASRRDWPLERIFAEANENRAKLIESLARLTEEQVAQPMHFAGDAKRKGGDLPLNMFLAGWAQHDPIHVADMVKALPERAAEPEIAAWLDDPFVRGYQAIMSGGHGN